MVANMNIHNVTSVEKTSKTINPPGRSNVIVHDYTFTFVDHMEHEQSIVITAFMDERRVDV
jgi:hypothetical protein